MTKNINNNNPDYYTVTSEWFRFKNPSQDVPFTQYIQYTYEKSEIGEKYIFSLKYEGYQFPKINEIKIDIGPYEEELNFSKTTLFKREGVRGVSETIFFEVSENLAEELVMADKVFLNIKGYTDFRYFLSKEAIEILDEFLIFVENSKK